MDVIVIEGRGETQLKLPGVQPPRIYESYEDLKEVLVYASRQNIQPQKNNGIAVSTVYSREAVVAQDNTGPREFLPITVDNGTTSAAVRPNREQRGLCCKKW